MRYVLFIKDSCPYCVKAKELLEEKQYNFKLVSFDPDQENILKEIKEAYKWPTVPMVFQVLDSTQIKFIGGYTDLVKYVGD